MTLSLCHAENSIFCLSRKIPKWNHKNQYGMFEATNLFVWSARIPSVRAQLNRTLGTLSFESLITTGTRCFDSRSGETTDAIACKGCYLWKIKKTYYKNNLSQHKQQRTIMIRKWQSMKCRCSPKLIEFSVVQLHVHTLITNRVVRRARYAFSPPRVTIWGISVLLVQEAPKTPINCGNCLITASRTA